MEPRGRFATLSDTRVPPGKALDLAVVLPTFNERQNVSLLLDRLESVLAGISYEVVIVDDDSPDGTWKEASGFARERREVRILRRIGRRGLASACLEGMLATAAPYIAVMDADLQHDESILPRMYATARDRELDVVVATRNAGDGSMGEFGEGRQKLSDLGRKMSRLVLNAQVSDPMSGFFLVDRKFVEEVIYSVSGVGFKILLDLLASAQRPVRVAEVPYTFRTRQHGESKLSLTVGLEYLYLLLDKLIGRFVPLRFALFAMVGMLGVVLHLAVVGLLYVSMGSTFRNAQVAATIVTMTGNFLLNNLVTYGDARLRGWRWVTGLLGFYVACSIGAVINVEIAESMLASRFPWTLSGLAGLVVSGVWNYGVTSVAIWRQENKRRRG